MKTNSRFHGSIEGITLGDHLITITPDGARHGIYAGDCRVISVKSGVVSSEPLEEFSSSNFLDVYLQTSEFAAAEIARRAENLVGVVIEPGNEQYFCEWCLRGLRVAP